MKNTALLIGNDINNLSPGLSWIDLLHKMTTYCGVQDDIVISPDKPFPILYEEIFLKALQKGRINEKDLKAFIAESVSQIGQNEIHAQIRSLNFGHILTTNYDFSLEGAIPMHNSGIIRETLYSIFRKNEVGNTTYWHIHGDANNPLSINLGFEHYCGQLQNMRNYLVTGTNYTNSKVNKDPLERRLERKAVVDIQSWIDLFFVKDIHIFGLALDFVETDLWWLLTYRARSKFYKNKIEVTNKIVYYIPEKYKKFSQYKIDVLEANGVQVLSPYGKDKLEYYRAVLRYCVGL
jgi:hypothetical protein